MNPENVICDNCGADVLIEPEVANDEDAICGMCKGYLFYHEEEENNIYEI